MALFVASGFAVVRRPAKVQGQQWELWLLALLQGRVEVGSQPLSSPLAPARYLGPELAAGLGPTLSLEQLQDWEHRQGWRWWMLDDGPGLPAHPSDEALDVAGLPVPPALAETMAWLVRALNEGTIDVRQALLLTDWLTHVTFEAWVQALEQQARERMPTAQWLVAASGRALTLWAEVMARHMEHRDQVICVVAAGADVQGSEELRGPWSHSARVDWLDHHFRHERLDTEVVTLVPWVTAPTGRWPEDRQRLPEPRFVGRESANLEHVPLAAELMAQPEGPLALRLTADLWTRSRR